MKGVFGLKSPQDLFKKLESEYESLRANPSDAYVAYNFFATAWHLLEWKYPGKRGTSNAIAREKIRHGSTLLQLCEHLAPVTAMDSENILPRVAGRYLAAALQTLPKAETAIVDTMEATIDVHGIGTVRVTGKRMKAKRGKFVHYFWTSETAGGCEVTGAEIEVGGVGFGSVRPPLRSACYRNSHSLSINARQYVTPIARAPHQVGPSGEKALR